MHKRLTVTAVGIVALLALSTATAQAAPPSPTPGTSAPRGRATPTPVGPDADLAAAVRRDLNMGWEQYTQTSALASRAEQAKQTLSAVPGFHALGITDGRLVAAGTGSAFTQAAQRAGVPTRAGFEVPDPAGLASYLNTLPAGAVHAIGKDLDGYTITLATSADAKPAPRGVKIKRASQRPKARAEVGAGQDLTSTNGSTSSQCQTAFTVTDASGNPGVLTAGHCTRDGGYKQFTVTNKAGSSARLGELVFNQFGAPGNRPVSDEFSDDPADFGTDLAVIAAGADNTITADLPTPTSTGAAHITTSASPVPGLPVCARVRNEPANGGWRCGSVATIDARYIETTTFPTSPRGINVFTITGLSTGNGDSGAPIIANTTAIGLVSASSTEGQTPVVYAVPVRDALVQYQPNTHIKLWVPQPTITAAAPAGPNWATANWQTGTPITGTMPAGDGTITLDIQLDNTPLTTITTNPDGTFSFTLPADLTTAKPHTITLTAHRGAETATPLNVVIPNLVDGATRDNWVTNGGPTGRIGLPTGPLACGLVDQGCYQSFDNAFIYTSPAAGTHSIGGRIRDKWAETGWEKGFLGYPTTDEICGLINGGCWQDFQHGAIYWHPDTDAHYTIGAIRERYSALGWEHGILGYPTSDEICEPGLKCYQRFQHGRIYYTPDTGAHATYGNIGDKYTAIGGPWTSELGWPTAEETCDTSHSVCSQDFATGRITWSVHGTYAIRGHIWNKYRTTGAEQNIGLPTSDEICDAPHATCHQKFTIGNGVIQWYNDLGTFIMRGEIYNKWVLLGGNGSLVGRPISDEGCGLINNGCYQKFEHNKAHIYWQATAGPHYIRGAILDRYAAQNWENGTLGYPTTDERCGLKDNGCDQLFATETDKTRHARTISWSPTTPAIAIQRPTILNTWNDTGRENGQYGYPTAEPNTNAYGQWVQPFQRGVIVG